MKNILNYIQNFKFKENNKKNIRIKKLLLILKNSFTKNTF